MNSHLILFFAYHFPPENAAGAARPYRFFKYLSRLGYDCQVITAAKQDGRFGGNVHYVPDRFVNLKSGKEWQLERFLRKCFFPAAVGFTWSKDASDRGFDLIRSLRPSKITIISTFPPIGTLFAGWRMARLGGFPWIADFRDPFPLRIGPGASFKHQLAAYRLLENVFINYTSVLIANTDAAADIWKKRFPKHKDRVQVIWNGF